MKILKVTLNVENIPEEEQGSLFIEIENKLLELKDSETQMNVDEKNIFIFIGKGEKSKELKDFAIEGKIIKEFGLKYKIFTNENYLNCFNIEDVANINKESQDEKIVDNLDEFISEVPKDDNKVLDIMSQLKNIKKKVK